MSSKVVKMSDRVGVGCPGEAGLLRHSQNRLAQQTPMFLDFIQLIAMGETTLSNIILLSEACFIKINIA
jgi:hypothetical protein